ncbi:hypothetical protein GQ457_01G029620 [Hibiscus cannabinus]
MRGNRLHEECLSSFHSHKNVVIQRLFERWKCLPLGWVKINVDVAANTIDQWSTIEGIIQDDSGSWLFGFYMLIGRSSALLAEHWAIYDALHRAWEKGFRSIEIKSGCLEAIQMVMGKSEICMGHALVAEIQECNGCADRLDALGRVQAIESMDFDDLPAELLVLLQEEAPSLD